LTAWRTNGGALEGSIPITRVTKAEWNFTPGRGNELFDRLAEMPVKLGEVGRIFQGLVTGADKVFTLQYIGKSKPGLVKVQDSNSAEWLLEEEIMRPFIKDVSLSSYGRLISRHRIIFPYNLEGGRGELIPSRDFSKRYPRIWKYLTANEETLRGRESGKWNNDRWYSFGRTQNLIQMDDPKLIVQVISLKGRYTYDDSGIYFTGGGNGPYYGVRWAKTDNPHSLHYLQGLLNSKLLDGYLHSISSPFRGGYWSYGKRFIEKLPIRTIDFSDPADKACHDKMVTRVERMLDLHKQLAAAKNPDDKTRLQREIEATDRQLDQLVYELYGLTKEEIRIVEEVMQ
jgi:hypothetical protein